MILERSVIHEISWNLQLIGASNYDQSIKIIIEYTIYRRTLDIS